LWHFPIAYQQEYFNQLTSEQVRTRFVRGHPVRYWFNLSGVGNEALDRWVYAVATLHARALSVGSIPAYLAGRAACTAHTRRPGSADSLIISCGASEPVRAAADQL
jgi:phage terminase large subunit GpA-like protein